MIGKQIGLYISIFLFLKFTRYSIHKRRRFGFAFFACSRARVAANYNHN